MGTTTSTMKVLGSTHTRKGNHKHLEHNNISLALSKGHKATIKTMSLTLERSTISVSATCDEEQATLSCHTHGLRSREPSFFSFCYQHFLLLLHPIPRTTFISFTAQSIYTMFSLILYNYKDRGYRYEERIKE